MARIKHYDPEKQEWVYSDKAFNPGDSSERATNADLSQNDPSAADYVKNRTHYKVVQGEVTVFEGALDTFTTTDNIPIAYDIPVGTSMTAYHGSTVVGTAVGYESAGVYFGFSPDLSLTVDNATHTAKSYNGVGSETIKFVAADLCVEIKRLDEEFIPETIARTADTYTKTEIDAIMGSYITDIDTLVGGDA